MTVGALHTGAPTLRALLNAPGLGLAVPDGAQDLDRPISWAHITEMRDPSRYLRGGELVCTVGLSLQSPQDCRTFAGALATARAAGVCFGVGDGHDAVPAALLDECSRHRLPVLIAAPSVPFSTVHRRVRTRRRDRGRAGDVRSGAGDALVVATACVGT
jgi:hypothetical protein